jgi:hypothetical protein
VKAFATDLSNRKNQLQERFESAKTDVSFLVSSPLRAEVEASSSSLPY